MEHGLPSYDTTVIISQEATEETLGELRSKISSIIGKYSGETVEWEDLGKRKLAYPIGKESRGQYLKVVFTGNSKLVAELERNLRINDSVIRYLTVSMGEEMTKDRLSARLATALKKAKERESARALDPKKPRIEPDEDKKLMGSRPPSKKVKRIDIDRKSGPNPLDFRDINFLKTFIADNGKIVPSRVTGVSAYSQRKITQAIKRARVMALLPFVI